MTLADSWVIESLALDSCVDTHDVDSASPKDRLCPLLGLYLIPHGREDSRGRADL